MATRVAATPAAPQAPWGCPICDFKADIGTLTACSPSASFNACVSMRSLSLVEGPCRLFAALFEPHAMKRLAGRAVPADFRQHRRPAPSGMLILLEYKHPRALSQHKPVAVGRERA